MEQVKYLILGAGPAGLTAARRLIDNGETSVLVLEKEEAAGGLCRSVPVDGAPLDIGGGHFLDVRRQGVNEFLFRFMPEQEWDRYERNSVISFGEGYIGHPFEANIWQMKKEQQEEYLQSIAQAGCNTGEPMPEDFVPWIYWKLGGKIAENYMLPYNQKMFGANLNELGTYWLNKLPNVSYGDTKKSCEDKCAYGEQPGHASFYYPKCYGYGELWRRIQESLGERLLTGKEVSNVSFSDRKVTCSDKSVYQAQVILLTIPWMSFEAGGGIPEEYKRLISRLKYSSVQVEYFPQNLETHAHWIYYPQRDISYHRILVRHNFCPGSKGYWTETNMERVVEGGGYFRYSNRYAYPLNSKEKPEIMQKLLLFAQERGIYGLGRWGEHCHYNSDVVVELSLAMADRLCNAAGKDVLRTNV